MLRTSSPWHIAFHRTARPSHRRTCARWHSSLHSVPIPFHYNTVATAHLRSVTHSIPFHDNPLLAAAHLLSVARCEVVAARRDGEVAGPERRLPDRERARVERRGRGEPPIALVEHREVVRPRRDLRVRAPQRALADRERALRERRGLRTVPRKRTTQRAGWNTPRAQRGQRARRQTRACVPRTDLRHSPSRGEQHSFPPRRGHTPRVRAFPRRPRDAGLAQGATTTSAHVSSKRRHASEGWVGRLCALLLLVARSLARSLAHTAAEVTSEVLPSSSRRTHHDTA